MSGAPVFADEATAFGVLTVIRNSGAVAAKA
jgi:hypothetical protein